jgi:hypothetical protein
MDQKSRVNLSFKEPNWGCFDKKKKNKKKRVKHVDGHQINQVFYVF